MLKKTGIILIYINILLCIISQQTSLAETTIIVESLTRVYDGDTIYVNIKDWHPVVGRNMPVRIAHIDTPEIRGKCAQEVVLAIKARQHLKKLAANAKKIELFNVKRDMYFRLLADVSIDGVDLGRDLLSKGMAVPYEGGTKEKNWCN